MPTCIRKTKHGGGTRGRGRGRGRGRSAVVNARSPSKASVRVQIRAQRKAVTRQALLESKRNATLHRIMLPEASPRKRHVERSSSPLPQPCESDPMPDVKMEQVWCEDGIVDRPNPTSSQSVVELVVYEDGTVGGPIPSSSPNVIVFAENNIELTEEDWLCNFELVYSDDEDLNIDLPDDIALPLVQRYATDQIADNSGLSTIQVETISQEEEINDRHIRDLAPNDEYYEFNWTKNRHIFTGSREVFTGCPGPTFPVTNATSVTDVFYKMFDTDFVDLLVTETNRYAQQTMTKLKGDPSKKNSRLLRWTPTNRDEMLAFLALMILQGLYPKVNEESYFSFDGYGTTPYFNRIMSYNRYRLLKTFQHFIDNETTKDMTKLKKILPVVHYLNDKFSNLYKPSQEIAIDESLLNSHGRLSFTQKINTKAAQVGVKTYELCESSTGYLWRFFVYTGKDVSNGTGAGHRLSTNGPEDTGQARQTTDQNKLGNDGGIDISPKNATAQIVYYLIDPLLHLGHTLIMDNYYNSPLLARCLKRDGRTDVFGTLRLTREFVPESIKTFTKKDLQLGEEVVAYCPDLAVMLWRDSNLVSMISTFHPLEVSSKQKNYRLTYKPSIVMDYNKSMGGIDRKDQLLSAQPLERHRSKVWYQKLFRRLYNAAVFNCYIIFSSGGIILSHRKFRKVLAESLLQIHRKIDLTVEPRFLNVKTATPTLSVVTMKRPYVEENHFPAAAESRFKVCVMCKKSRTAYQCEQCAVNLCILGCFKQYHKFIPT